MFKRAKRSMKRLLSARELIRFDSTSGDGATRLSLRLKDCEGERYVVLALRAPGHSHFTELSRDEFERLAANVERVRAAITSTQLA